jgi:hypothetical protein
VSTKVIENKIYHSKSLLIDKTSRKYKALKASLKFKNEIAEEFYSAGLISIYESLKNCEETKSLMLCSHCGGGFYATTRCRKRICPICSYRVAQERRRYLHHLCRALKHPKLITLTMPRWHGDPREGIKILKDGFHKLRKRDVFASVKGGAYTIEVLPKDNGWHIHLHLLCDSAYIPHTKLFAAWRDILHIRYVSVDIQSAASRKAQYYIAKYVSKPGERAIPLNRMVEYHLAIKGIRLFGTFGTFYNYKIEATENEDDKIAHQSVCPLCGATGSVFNARDGPFIYGLEDWKQLSQTMIAGRELIIPNEDYT